MGCGHSGQTDHVLFDFESDSDLDKFLWECHLLFGLSEQHATHGAKSLKLEFFPNNYPSLNPILFREDWGPYSEFVFDVYNPQAVDVELGLCIDDRSDSPPPEDRYGRSFILRPGANFITLRLDNLTTAKGERKLDLNKICSVLIFVEKPQEWVVLYFDYFRLKR
jgi:hypothetical protein